MSLSRSVPADEIAERTRSVQAELRMAELAVDAALVVQRADLFYLTGTTQQCHLALPADGEPRLLVRKVLERAIVDSAVNAIVPIRSLKELPGHLNDLCGPPPWRLGMELDVLPASVVETYRGVLGERTAIVDCSAALMSARARKSGWELEQLREAAALHSMLFDAPLRAMLAAPDLTTFELQTELEAEARRLGHCGIIRLRGLDAECGIGVVASGPDGAMPSNSMFPIGGVGPHAWVAAGGSHAPIARDTPIVLDFLMSTTGYHADCTRMAVRGTLPDAAAAILDGIRELLRRLEGDLVMGALPSAIYASALGHAADLGLDDGFMGPAGHQVRFVGHGVGLEVNELPVVGPRSNEPLRTGNVVAVEPKFTHADYGVIGLENTYAITDDGADKLTLPSESITAVD